MVQIHIIGVTQADDLVGVALQTVQQANAIIGSKRQLDILRPHLFPESLVATATEASRQTNTQPSLNILPNLHELKALIDELSLLCAKEQASQKPDSEKSHQSSVASIVVLASGDPLYYGIGRWFSKHFAQKRLTFYPAISSIQMACHRLAISLQDVTVLSLHGRPLATLRTKLKNATTLLILTDKHSSPHALARECQDTGFAQSRITVLENLSYPHERIRTFSVAQLLDTSTGTDTANNEIDPFDPLHISVINVKRGLKKDRRRERERDEKKESQSGVDLFLPEFPGIPDIAYITGAEAGKGMITKREVRLCILSLLQPSNQDIIWDIGAGCGGVAIELAYWNDNASIYAIECHAERLTHLSANQQRFGVVKNLHIINGHAPECLVDLPLPNKVFIGGSGGKMKTILETVWPILPKGGLLVVSAVVQETQQSLSDFAKKLSSQDTLLTTEFSTTAAEIEVVEVSVKRGQLTNTGLDYTSKLPVVVFKFKKV